MDAAKSKIWLEIFDWVKTIAVAVVVALLIRQFVFNISIVPTGSMVPTIKEKDMIIVLRCAYFFKDVERGDIVVFKATDEVNNLRPEKERKSPLVKRVIAIGGDSVEIKGGTVYVNDSPLSETYVYNKSYEDMEKIIVPDDSYFFMGDNRRSSWDARYWENQFVPKSNIMGEAVFKFGRLR